MGTLYDLERTGGILVYVMSEHRRRTIMTYAGIQPVRYTSYEPHIPPASGQVIGGF